MFCSGDIHFETQSKIPLQWMTIILMSKSLLMIKQYSGKKLNLLKTLGTITALQLVHDSMHSSSWFAQITVDSLESGA
jgi:hypothetical protein